MKLHRNARTCPNSRALIAARVIDRGWSLRSAAEAAGVSEPTAQVGASRWGGRIARGSLFGAASDPASHRR
jgi:hypothetical protein